MASTIASLFQGTTPPPSTAYTQNATSTPSWLQNYAGSLVSSADSVASQPYQQFPGPQVAPWSPDQYSAQSQIEGLQGQYAPQMAQAQGLTAAASNPAQFGQAQSYMPGAQAAIQGAYDPSQFTAAQSYLPQASSMISNALTPTQAQMNPYESNVINQAENQATQYWNQTLQPSINQQYAAAGQAGSSADINAQNQGANLITQNIQNTAQSALAGAYQNAQTAGLQGAQQMAGLGTAQSGITSQQAAAGLGQGQALGTLSQLQGGLGYEQGILGLQGAGQQANLASTSQNLGLQGAGTLYNIGQQQQAQGQSNLTNAYNQFENQTYYPENQLSWLQGIMTGTPSLTGTASQGTTAGPLPGAQYGATPLNQGLGIYNGLSGLAGLSSAPAATTSP